MELATRRLLGQRHLNHSMENAKFIRRANITDYAGDQTVTIGSGGGSDTVENVPLQQGVAYEFEIEGKRVVFIGYDREN